ncbi:MAG: quinone-dependent dihydroorotate dehydrogenase [Cyclobacteriaceae bacterium]|nr:quinone-dependent dihydroorotate dehydrogenase [Cyclobacteriaceae bacterium]
MYKSLIRPLLFLLSPERAHHFTFRLLSLICRIPGVGRWLGWLYTLKDPSLEKKLLGLTFPNPVGLAAGFDKDARLIDELSCFGFGFIEIGTITPVGQPGNDKPRLFRLSTDQALINRMGFNNDGAEDAAKRLRARRSRVIVGGNIGKNKLTANEHAENDYVRCIEALYPYVDYFVVNVSSPNTPGLRELQEKEPLRKLLERIRSIIRTKDIRKPILLKIAPDLTVDQLDEVAVVLRESADGVIATNTTTSREGLSTDPGRVAKYGPGGLSGAPLKNQSLEVVRHLRKILGKEYPIIGVGGIMLPEDAVDMLRAGADLVQIYTGFIYEGPGLVAAINREILSVG